MSNNDLRCSNCGGQHHPAECLKEVAMTEAEKRLVEIMKKELWADKDIDGCAYVDEDSITDTAQAILKSYISKSEVLIQMTKAVRLLEDEGYNDKTLDPMRTMVKQIRKDLNVERVKTAGCEEIIYKPTS